MNRKGPWEGYRRQAKRVSPVVSFPPSFARTLSSKERLLGTRQLPNDVLKRKRGSFLSLSSDLMKGAKRYLFSSWKRCSQKRQNGIFLHLEVMLLKVRKRYLFKNTKSCFQAFGKPFKILLVDRCQPLVPLKLQ